jgi:hypothetical protein
VTDPSGALVPNAHVTVTNEDTGVTVKGETTRAGVYAIEALNPGKYRVIVEHQGFKQIEVLDLVLHTQDVISRNFVLPVGASSETIQVNGNQQSMSNSPSVSLTVTQAFVENMPLNGRSFQDLIALAPGSLSSNRQGFGAYGAYSINGQRDDANNFSVDGVSANLAADAGQNGGPGGGVQAVSGSYPMQSALGTTQSLVSIDALQEFRIQTSGYSAEFGRQPGGQVEFTTRSGTNEYHGGAFDYLRNTVMDANDWFANAKSQPREPEHQNDFGGTFGGPLSLPQLYDGKDKPFFFFSYEGLRLILPGFVSFSVPTADFRQAAAVGVQPYLDTSPIPNGPLNPDGITALFSHGLDSRNSLDSWSFRLDQAIGSKLHMFARFFDTPSYTEQPTTQPLSEALFNRINSIGGTLGATLLVSPNLVNEFRFNYTEASGQNYSGVSPDF